MTRVFSGIQPTGNAQLGNYIGAVKRWVELQKDKNKENIYCVVDLHAITVRQDPKVLRDKITETFALLLACGLNPNDSNIFVQSDVKEHSELCWYLNCITPLGWLNKMTQFKDKSIKQESIDTGLLDYPVLMAADILLYDTDEVPVGDDQKQHVELTRNIAERFNHIFGETFVIPKPIIATNGARIMGLDNPLNKMSKSNEHVKGHSITLLQSEDEILTTFKRAQTDSFNEILFSDDKDRAGVNNLLQIFSSISGLDKNETINYFSKARGYGDLKIAVAELVIKEFKPIKEKFNLIINDKSELEKLRKFGAEKASEIAHKKILNVRSCMGFA
ncbi:MAG: tryptophan--tRNA ligase [Chlorobi bacterium]|nr:tryptophan--tRNA ligase [Chlorobiota bacterium]